jgi:hypothetical protein
LASGYYTRVDQIDTSGLGANARLMEGGQGSKPLVHFQVRPDPLAH